MAISPYSPLYGMTPAQLQTALTNAQAAWLALSSGQRTVTLSYSQGDGSKSVTYDRVEGGIKQIELLIQQIQAALGNVCGPRRRFARFSWGWR